MLPSKGYFNDIECPYLENNCGRPYCHFNHRKKQDNSNELPVQECSIKEIPTYNPTPKSELAVRKSHIPISYVPDVYNIDKSKTRPFRSNPISDITYKPTPISILNSVAINNVANDSSSNTQQGLDSNYVPEKKIIKTGENEKIFNENKEKYEYKPTEQDVEYNYNPTSHKNVDEESLLDIVYKPNSCSSRSIPNVEYTPSACSKHSSTINFEILDNEFEMIDEIINMTDIPDKSKVELLNENETYSSDSSSESEKKSSVSKISQQIENAHGIQDKGRSPNKTKERSSSMKESLKPEHKSKKIDKEKVVDKREDVSKRKNDRKEKKDDKSEKTETKARDSKKYDKHKNDSREKKIDSKELSSHSKKEADKKNHKSKHRDKDNKKKDEKTISSNKERDKHKSSRHKSERSDNNNKKHEKRHSKHDDKKKEESSKQNSSNEKKDNMIQHKANLESAHIDFDVDIDIDDQQTMEECFKIFNEYKSSVSQTTINESIPVQNDCDLVEELTASKKRIAHSNAVNTIPKIQLPKPIAKPTPGQIMNNRYRIIKVAQADNEENLIKREVKTFFKHPQPAPIIPAKRVKLNEGKHVFPTSSTSLIDDIINKTNSKPTMKKIAPVTHVIDIQKAKAKLLNERQEHEQSLKTIAQTNKTGKRQAHIPDYSLSDIPDVLDVDKSKLPVNVRSRFLTLLADECCKLYLAQKDAYKRALDEEYSCYQKCKVLVTYRNSAMLAVNRLRKELKEREEKNLGPIGSGEGGQVQKEDSERKSLYSKIEQYVLTEEELDIHGYPRESATPGRAKIKNQKTANFIPLPKNQKKCCRCSKIYLVDDDGKAIYEEECLYHPLKKRTIRGEQIYLCCKSTDDSGCATCHAHVSESPEDAELEGFQVTLPPNSDNDPRSSAVYALDCEMCYTTKGLELTRVTVIDSNCKTVYESLVKPLSEIIDYNTRFSGITKQQMDRTSTGILQVQANILHLCNSKTILIGHSLESDMKALKIIHSTIVDTAVLFPHKMGLPHKRALRTLACDYLKKIIQNDVGGHDSAEDAITCMELIKWKVKEDTKFRS